MMMNRLKLITTVLLGVGILALSVSCIVPVYEYDGWGYRHRYYRGYRGDACVSGGVVYREERR